MNTAVSHTAVVILAAVGRIKLVAFWVRISIPLNVSSNIAPACTVPNAVIVFVPVIIGEFQVAVDKSVVVAEAIFAQLFKSNASAAMIILPFVALLVDCNVKSSQDAVPQMIVWPVALPDNKVYCVWSSSHNQDRFQWSEVEAALNIVVNALSIVAVVSDSWNDIRPINIELNSNLTGKLEDVHAVCAAANELNVPQ